MTTEATVRRVGWATRHWAVKGGDRAVRLLGRPGLAIAAVAVLANAIPGGALLFYLQYLLPGAGRVANPSHAGTVMLIVFALYVASVVPIGVLHGLHVFTPVLHWLAEDRPARPDEQLAILRLPASLALAGFCSWAAAAVVFGVTEGLLGYPGPRVFTVVAGILLAAVSVTALTALLIERLLRPMVRHALAASLPTRPLGIRVLPRLLLSWAFGSGVPLIALLLAPIDQGNGSLRSFTGPIGVLCVAGLVSGFTIITGAARAVSEPLNGIREALERVEAGDLSVQVPVDDGSEVGQLQAGVNRMVAGLRQRRQLEDLFGRYVGTEVAGQALDRGLGLSGERCDATVLFVDIIGSTAMAADVPPEEVVSTLNAYFAAVVGAVQAEGGWVNKFEGDGALCVFGPPDHRADHAAAGLRAARRLYAGVARAAEKYPRLLAAVGVSSGSVVAGTIGSTERFEYTVIGDPVNEAARLTDLAKGRHVRVLASQATVEAAGAEGELWTAAGEAILRGRPRPTRLYAPAATA
jgi:adenylate cyclase